MSKREVLVLDRQGIVCAGLGRDPETSAGWRVRHADSARTAAQLLGSAEFLVGLVVFEVDRSPDPQELEPLLTRTAVEWIALVSEQALADPTLRRFLLRAFHDFHTLPVDAGRLAVTLGHAYGRSRLRRGLAPSGASAGRYGMVGGSPPMLDLFRRIDKVVRADAPVLIGGESGTGKELVARAIHRCSSRADGPFVALNCGAIPSNLIQSELFGHERGAFTGAYQRKTGRIEAAHGGVLFLDEIGDLPLDLQANLLHVLQERAIVRLGSTQRVPVNVRVIAATHVNLEHAVTARSFREDLFYRLKVLHLEMPPLRDRVGDVALLADHFFHGFARLAHVLVAGFSNDAYRAMNAYRWPGNVRELINCVQRAVVMSENRLISPADLGLELSPGDVLGVTLRRARASVERTVVESCLRANRNNVSQTARQLGVSRVTMHRLINRFNIDTNACHSDEPLTGGNDGDVTLPSAGI